MEALLYEPLKNKKVRCNLCCHRCGIKPGQRGRCHVRENRDGKLSTLVYGNLVARGVDPIEKKPLFPSFAAASFTNSADTGCFLNQINIIS